MANDMSAYLKAMAQVRDVQIDPKTGATLGVKNESILQKIDKVAPLKGDLKEALNSPLAKESSKQMSKIQEAYMKNFTNLDPDALKKQKELNEATKKTTFLKVGNRPDESDYMKILAGKCAKNKF